MASKPTTDLASTKPAPKPAKTAVSNLVLGNADDALRLAKELQKFVHDNQLTSTIQGKAFPNVEAWQFAGGLLGLASMLERIEDHSTDTEIRWHATVQVVHLATGNVVGRGFATCSTKESSKKFFADYAIASMAQTRAVGKAYRLSLGWLMKAAGYEATPAEEMSEQPEAGTYAQVVANPPAAAPAPAPAGEPLARYALDEAIKAVLTVASREAMQQLWPHLEEHRGEPVFDLACTATKMRWPAPAAGTDEQAQTGFATRGQRDKAHQALANHKNDGYRIEALHLLSEPGLTFSQASAIVDRSLANLQAQPARVDGTAQQKRAPVVTPAPGQQVPLATAAQKEELFRLLNNPVITRQEKTKMIGALPALTEQRAEQSIRRLRKAVEERETSVAIAA